MQPFLTKKMCFDTGRIRQQICAVDLGLNTDVTCAIMDQDGTVYKTHLRKTHGLKPGMNHYRRGSFVC